MNKLTIIGNLTRDPESRTLKSGDVVCSFSMAVNRRTSGEQQADFFRVSVWGKMGEACQRYLAKGRKVAVVGAVSVSTYESRDGGTRYSLDVRADDVEFLTPKDAQGASPAGVPKAGASDGYTEILDDDLPF